MNKTFLMFSVLFCVLTSYTSESMEVTEFMYKDSPQKTTYLNKTPVTIGKCKDSMSGNAFSFYSAKTKSYRIFICRDLVDTYNTESIAFITYHEYAHIVSKHLLNRAVLEDLVSSSELNRFRRHQERIADEIAFDMILKDNPKAGEEYCEFLKDLSVMDKSVVLTTHPNSLERYKRCIKRMNP